MRQVSEESQDLVAQLVAWEMLGREDLDAKVLVRQIPLADLSLIVANMEDGGIKSTVLDLVTLELQYRLGQLDGDWNYERRGQNVSISVPMKTPINYVSTHVII